MGLNILELMFVFACVGVMLDTHLTIATLRVMKRLKLYDVNREKNVIARKFIGNNPAWWKATIWSIVAITVIYFTTFYFMSAMFQKVIAVGFFGGAMLIVNWLHIANLADLEFIEKDAKLLAIERRRRTAFDKRVKEMKLEKAYEGYDG